MVSGQQAKTPMQGSWQSKVEGLGARSLEPELSRVYDVEAEGTTRGISILISLRLRRADKAS